MNYIIKTTNNELYHHGILGQKWGVRRYQNKDGSLTPAGKKKYAIKGFTEDAYNSNKTKAGKIYDKLTDAHKYNGKIMYGRSSQKDRDARAEKYFNEHYKNNHKDYNEVAKKERKTAIKNTTKELNKNASTSDKLIYNNATRRKAAKYIVDNNMSVEEATKKAKGEAWRNTAMFTATYGLVTVGYILRTKK